jgi:hypothetical protein
VKPSKLAAVKAVVSVIPTRVATSSRVSKPSPSAFTVASEITTSAAAVAFVVATT